MVTQTSTYVGDPAPITLHLGLDELCRRSNVAIGATRSERHMVDGGGHCERSLIANSIVRLASSLLITDPIVSSEITSDIGPC